MSDVDATTAPAAPEAKPEVVEEQKPAAEETGKTEEPTAEAKQETAEEKKTETESKEGDSKEDAAKADDKQILKTKGKIDYENPQNNRKFDPAARGVTDDPNAIRKQVRSIPIHAGFCPLDSD